ncbi:HAMP domain-containing histidine kinase [Clostridium sp. SHJSY1]|uniref:sensor histidine kinase n=1 Tax=Clostridium sp. SHJSY1 TaxID=2942483 RepID=UPI002876FA32|nr:HAMP domain-containing sensor histidine kinase [Clostridium sp. SHJSY1]MDS0527152.1 HAMP domain-containing histidine kinase [Clostridium sp. SHJSY1]
MLDKDNIVIDTYKNKEKKIITFCSVIAPICFMLLTSISVENGEKILVLLVEIFCTSLGLCVGAISFLNKELKEGPFYKNIGIGFFFIGLMTFSIVIMLLLYDFKSVITNELFVTLKVATYYLEYCVIILAYLFAISKNSISFNKTLYSMIFSVFVIIGISIYMNRSIKSFISNEYSEVLFVFPVAILLCVIIWLDKKFLSKKEKCLIYEFIVCILIHQTTFIAYCYMGHGLIYLAGISKYFAYYILFDFSSTYVLKKSYIAMKKNLIEAQKTEKELNNLLKKRNKTLVELEYLIEKSGKRYGELIEGISDGIIIFYFDKIYYINSEANNIIGGIGDSELKDIRFNDFTENILPKKLIVDNYSVIKQRIDEVERKEIESFKFEVASYSGIQYEMYFLNIDSINRLVYMKNVTETNRNYEFKRKYKEYMEAEELKNEFYSNISHELRTPINLIYSALQLCEVNLNDDKLETIEKHNETIKHNCLRLIRTINNFIDTNKISEGYLNPNMKIHNIVSVVENISLACNKYMEKINNNLIFDSEEEEFYVECDKDMMERVILNILSNSVKFGRDGGTTTVNISAYESEVIIKIRNNGYTVDKEVMPYIFDKFTKINKSLNRTTEGSGLGLYLTKALLELQGGIISLESNDDIGTEFIINLPRSYDEERCECEEEFEMMNPTNEKVDIEFSDIYI